MWNGWESQLSALLAALSLNQSAFEASARHGASLPDLRAFLSIEDINILASADLRILAGDFTVRVFPSVQCIDAAMVLIDHLQFGSHWKPCPPPVSFNSRTIHTLSVPPRMHIVHVDCTKAKH